jgi:hypothetical protein
MVDADAQEVIEGLVQRCALANQAFNRINTVAKEHGLIYSPEELTSINIVCDQLLEVLVASGLIDKVQFMQDVLARQAESLEEQLANAAADFRERTGLMVPLGVSGRPQG